MMKLIAAIKKKLITMKTKPNDSIQSIPMVQTGDTEFRPAKPNEKGDYMHVSAGLTKREHFAALAMQSYAGGEFTGQSGMNLDRIAKWSVDMADELIKALNAHSC